MGYLVKSDQQYYSSNTIILSLINKIKITFPRYTDNQLINLFILDYHRIMESI